MSLSLKISHIYGADKLMLKTLFFECEYSAIFLTASGQTVKKYPYSKKNLFYFIGKILVKLNLLKHNIRMLLQQTTNFYVNDQ